MENTIGSVVPRPSYEPPSYWHRACRELASADEILARLISTHGDEVLRGSGSAFRTLVNAIVGQQISVAAAAGIWERLTNAYPSLEATSLMGATVETLRKLGLSGRKAEYIQGVAAAFAAGKIDESRWEEMTDEEIQDELVALRGVGPWTAEMVLIFHARRPDILPLGDIGLVNAAARLYSWNESTSLADRRERLARHAERWRPWRTVATWFIWRDLDADPVIY